MNGGLSNTWKEEEMGSGLRQWLLGGGDVLSTRGCRSCAWCSGGWCGSPAAREIGGLPWSGSGDSVETTEVPAACTELVLGYGVKEEAMDVVRQRKEEEGDMRLSFGRVEED